MTEGFSNRELLTQGQADGGNALAAFAGDVGYSPGVTVYDDGSGAARSLEHLDSDDVGLLGDTVGGT